METEAIIRVARIFKDSLLIPLAREGVLNAEICRIASTEYINEMTLREKGTANIDITVDGEYRNLHPFSISPFELQGKEWMSIAHYYYSQPYVGVDEELVESIRLSQTPQIASRRALTAVQSFRMQRPDWEQVREIELDRAYRELMRTYPDALISLKSTGNARLVYKHPSDSFLGVQENGGKNILGATLMNIRSNPDL